MSFKLSKTLFIIESPLQLLSAYEAVHHFKLEKPVFLIRFSGKGSKNDSQLTKMSQLLLKDNRIIKVYIKPNFKSIKSIITVFLLQFLVSCYHIFGFKVCIGNLESKLASFISFFVKKKSIVYLDDGVASLDNPQFVSTSKSHFFSVFELSTTFLIKNKFTHLCKYLDSSYNKFKREDVVVFIGTPINELDICSFQDYLTFILKVKESYQAMDFIYFPHRREKKEFLNELSNHGIRIISNDFPIELFYMEFQEFHPKVVASLISSAIFTMNIIYNSEVIFSKDLINNKDPFLINIIEHIEKLNAKNISVC